MGMSLVERMTSLTPFSMSRSPIPGRRPRSVSRTGTPAQHHGVSSGVAPALTIDEQPVESEQCAVLLTHAAEDRRDAEIIRDLFSSLGISVMLSREGASDNGLQSRESAAAREVDVGLSRCTHLLGLLTLSNYDSWRVPYQLGCAMGKSRFCAHIIHRELPIAPSYIRMCPVLLDIDSLIQWISLSMYPVESTSDGSVHGELGNVLALNRTELEYI